MRTNTSGEAKLLEEFLHALCIFGLVGINLRIDTLEI
jgi:hypothetical protein